MRYFEGRVGDFVVFGGWGGQIHVLCIFIDITGNNNRRFVYILFMAALFIFLLMQYVFLL